MCEPLRCWRCRRVMPAWHEDYAVCAERDITDIPTDIDPRVEAARAKVKP